jgi:hypothetical protein
MLAAAAGHEKGVGPRDHARAPGHRSDPRSRGSRACLLAPAPTSRSVMNWGQLPKLSSTSSTSLPPALLRTVPLARLRRRVPTVEPQQAEPGGPAPVRDAVSISSSGVAPACGRNRARRAARWRAARPARPGLRSSMNGSCAEEFSRCWSGMKARMPPLLPTTPARRCASSSPRWKGRVHDGIGEVGMAHEAGQRFDPRQPCVQRRHSHRAVMPPSGACLT